MTNNKGNPQQTKPWQWWIEKFIVPVLIAVISGYFLLLSSGAIKNPFITNGTSTVTTTVDSPKNLISPTPPQEALSPSSITSIAGTTNVLITTTPATVILLSPTETVIQYYQYLNDREYNKAWGMFSMHFKLYGTYSGIEDYKAWASNINKVEVIEPITVLEENDSNAVVEVFKVIHYTGSGTNTFGLLKIYLSRIEVNSEWQIDAIGM